MNISKFVNYLNHHDPREVLIQDFDNFIKDSFMQAIWNEQSYTNQRIYWRDFSRLKSAFPGLNKPGIYIWGSGKQNDQQSMPKIIYVGQTKSQTLSKRLSGRYIGSSERAKQQQLRIADHFAKINRKNPTFEEVIQELFPTRWRNQNYHSLKYRYTGAMRFLKDGIDNIWVIVIPINDISTIDQLEVGLINIANEWNMKHHNEPLINKEHLAKN